MTNKTTPKKKTKLVERIQIIAAIIGSIAALTVVIIFITGKDNIPEFISPSNAPVVLFEDDFSDSANDWSTLQDNWAVRNYTNGEYTIKVGDGVSQNPASGSSTKWKECISGWSVVEIKKDNIAIEVTARVVGESLDGTYGIIFNYQDDDNFYFVEVTPRGRWDLSSMINSDFHDIVTFQNNPTPSIGLGKASNHLRIALTKDQVNYYVNDEELIKIKIPRPMGSVGLFVANCSSTTFEVAFDDFKVTGYPP
jgi:hypothetical protein